MVSVFYLDWLQKEYGPLLERFNKGDILQDPKLIDSDLKSAREMALALGNEPLPGQETPVRWKSRLSPEADSLYASGIAAQKEALAILLQASSSSDWSNTCQRLWRLWREAPNQQEIAAMFEQMASEQLVDTEFQKYRDKFEQVFARNAAQLIWARNLLREPE